MNKIISLFILFAFSPIYLLLAFISRFKCRKKIGLGPDPLLTNVYIKKALVLKGVKAETFVNRVYYITNDFDIMIKGYYSYVFFIYCIFSYRVIFIYFNGGVLSSGTPYNSYIKKIEFLFYKIAQIKIVVMPYGSDCRNFNYYNHIVYKNGFFMDYPSKIRENSVQAESNIKIWTKYANWIIAYCDIPNYLPCWDSLMLSPVAIDNKKYFPLNIATPLKFNEKRPLRILHAPNHKAIKGSDFIEKIINELKSEHYFIEYSCIQNVPNNEFVSIIQNTDIVIDQLVIGWHGIFAVEAMACKKPVLIYINAELEKMYTIAGLLEPNELPFIKTNYDTLKNDIINILNNPTQIAEIGTRSYAYVNKYHSMEYIGKIFFDILARVDCRD